MNCQVHKGRIAGMQTLGSLPKGRHGLSREEVEASQRTRLLRAALGYEGVSSERDAVIQQAYRESLAVGPLGVLPVPVITQSIRSPWSLACCRSSRPALT